MWVQKSSLSTHELDLMEGKIFQNASALHIHDLTFVMHEVVDG